MIPQFAGTGHHPLELAISGLVFALAGLVSLASYAAIFTRVRRMTARSGMRRILLRANGVVLVGFGGPLATARRL